LQGVVQSITNAGLYGLYFSNAFLKKVKMILTYSNKLTIKLNPVITTVYMIILTA